MKKFFKFVKENFFNKIGIISIILAELIFWSPSIVTGLLAIIVDARFWTAFSAYTSFWAIPITPAIPIQLAIAFGI